MGHFNYKWGNIKRSRMAVKILHIEDDEGFSDLIRSSLEEKGFAVMSSVDGEEGLLMAQELTPDMVLLDWILPNLSGIEICRRLRKTNKTQNIPIIMLTARAGEADRVRGLDMGADDYITKPFSPLELVARINAVLRRIRPSLPDKNLSYADIKIDGTCYKVTRGGNSVQLGPTEYKILQHLMENPQRVFSRDKLLDSIWGNDVYVELRTVDVHIRRLRKALNDGGKPDIIRTVRSVGYSLDADGI